MKTKEEYLNEIMNCSCDEAYKSRQMSDPTCAYCNYSDDIIEIMEAYASQFQSTERVSEAERERNKTDCNSYIDRAIKMLKDEFEDDPFTAKYNGIVSLLQYAQESHTASLSTPSEQEALWHGIEDTIISYYEKEGSVEDCRNELKSKYHITPKTKQ